MARVVGVQNDVRATDARLADHVPRLHALAHPQSRGQRMERHEAGLGPEMQFAQ